MDTRTFNYDCEGAWSHQSVAIRNINVEIIPGYCVGGKVRCHQHFSGLKVNAGKESE